MRFLVVGYGSIGKKHSTILRELGHEIVSVDPNPQIEADYRCAYSSPYLGDIEGELEVYKDSFDGILDCTPPDVRAGWQVLAQARFIEKPLGNMELAGSWFENEPVMIGFCYRWMPSLQSFRASLNDCRVYSLVIVSGQFLPEWHPVEDYRKRYYGGVVSDSLSHSLFIARWLMGDLKLFSKVIGKLSGLDIKVEDTATVLLKAPTGQPVLILADYLRQPRAFYIEAVTSQGVMRWDIDLDELPEMYHRQMEIFCAVASGERCYGFPDLEDGLFVQSLLNQISEGGRENV